ncbi:hypothetical protein FB451DRAFT_1524269, partial [Mycena latifolia]
FVSPPTRPGSGSPGRVSNFPPFTQGLLFTLLFSSVQSPASFDMSNSRKRRREVHFAPALSEPAPDQAEPPTIEPAAALTQPRIPIERSKKSGMRTASTSHASTSPASTSQATAADAGHTNRICARKRAGRRRGAAAPKLHPDLPKAREQVYDLYDDADDGGVDDMSDGGRELRNSDEPSSTMGRGPPQRIPRRVPALGGSSDHSPTCAACLLNPATTDVSIVSAAGNCYVQVARSKLIGVYPSIGSSIGMVSYRRCPVPTPASATISWSSTVTASTKSAWTIVVVAGVAHRTVAARSTVPCDDDESKVGGHVRSPSPLPPLIIRV